MAEIQYYGTGTQEFDSTHLLPARQRRIQRQPLAIGPSSKNETLPYGVRQPLQLTDTLGSSMFWNVGQRTAGPGWCSTSRHRPCTLRVQRKAQKAEAGWSAHFETPGQERKNTARRALARNSSSRNAKSSTRVYRSAPAKHRAAGCQALFHCRRTQVARLDRE